MHQSQNEKVRLNVGGSMFEVYQYYTETASIIWHLR